MKTYRLGETMSDEDSLAHFGVKGMKWGQRKKSPMPLGTRTSGAVGIKIGQKINAHRTAPDVSGVSRRDARQQIRKSNRDLSRRLEDFEVGPNRSDQIRTARANTKAAKRTYQDVKDDIKNQKSTGALGKNAARVVLNKARNERYETIYKAESRTFGEQAVEAFFTGVTGVLSTRR